MRLLTGLLVLALVSCQSTVEEPPAEISDKDTHYFADDVNEIVESETIEPDTIALFNNWIKSIINQQHLDSLLNKNYGFFVITSNGAMPSITKSYQFSDHFNLAEFIVTTLLKNQKREELPTIICETTIYDKQGVFVARENLLGKSRIWNYAGLHEKEIHEVEHFANGIAITLIDTEGYTYYFSLENNNWHLSFVDARSHCEG